MSLRDYFNGTNKGGGSAALSSSGATENLFELNRRLKQEREAMKEEEEERARKEAQREAQILMRKNAINDLKTQNKAAQAAKRTVAVDMNAVKKAAESAVVDSIVGKNKAAQTQSFYKKIENPGYAPYANDELRSLSKWAQENPESWNHYKKYSGYTNYTPVQQKAAVGTLIEDLDYYTSGKKTDESLDRDNESVRPLSERYSSGRAAADERAGITSSKGGPGAAARASHLAANAEDARDRLMWFWLYGGDDYAYLGDIINKDVGSGKGKAASTNKADAASQLNKLYKLWNYGVNASSDDPGVVTDPGARDVMRRQLLKGDVAGAKQTAKESQTKGIEKEIEAAGRVAELGKYAVSLPGKVWNYFMTDPHGFSEESHLWMDRATLGMDRAVSGVLDFLKGKVKGDEYYRSGDTFLDANDNLRREWNVDKRREDASTFGQIGADLAETIGFQLPTLTLTAATGASGLAANLITIGTFGSAAYADTKKEILSAKNPDGSYMYTKEQAELMARWAFLVEGVGETLLGDAFGVVPAAGSRIATAIGANVSNPTVKAMLSFLWESGEEGLEEIAQGLLERAGRSAILGDDFVIDGKELAYEGMLGALSGGLMGSVGLSERFRDAKNVHAADFDYLNQLSVAADSVNNKYDAAATILALERMRYANAMSVYSSDVIDAKSRARYIDSGLFAIESGLGEKFFGGKDLGDYISGEWEYITKSKKAPLRERMKGAVTSSVAEEMTKLALAETPGKREAVQAQAENASGEGENVREQTEQAGQAAPEATAGIENEAAGTPEKQQGAAETQRIAPESQRVAAETAPAATVSEAEDAGGEAAVKTGSARVEANSAGYEAAIEEYVPANERTGADVPEEAKSFAARTKATGQANGASPAQIAEAQALSELFGKLVLFDTGTGEEWRDYEFGFYRESDDTVHLNPRSRSERALWRVTAGEITHSFKADGADYASLLGYVKDNIAAAEGRGRTYKEIFDEKKRIYDERDRKNHGTAFVEQELLDSFAAKYLFDNEEQMRKLVSEKRSLAARFAARLGTWLKSHKATSKLGQLLYSDVKAARDTYVRLLNESRGAETKGEGIRHSYAGMGARTVNVGTLLEAQQMIRDGADPETVRQKTGWFKGIDGKWRFEIDDSDMKLIGDPEKYGSFINLGKMIEHDALFEAYPELSDYLVQFNKRNDGVRGAFHPGTNAFFEIDRDLKSDPDQLLNTLAHEIQHAVQYIEGFATGANVSYWSSKIDGGFDSRRGSAKQEFERLHNEYDEIRENRPQFFNDMLSLMVDTPKVPRGEINYDTLEQIEPDPVEWQEWDARRDALSKQYGEIDVFGFMNLYNSMNSVNQNGKRTAADLYLDTAGEIEARDVSARRTLTEDERREKRPDVDRRDAVFADGGVSYEIITGIKDVNGKEYDNVVQLDETTFKKIKHDGNSYLDFIRKNLFNKKITVYDKADNSETVEFAGPKERVKKDGAKNSHPVLGEIEKIRSSRGKLLVLNLAETAEISKLEKHSDENSHQWLDKNGWDTRYSYVVADDGLIHKVILYIAKTADGRNVLYSAKIEKEGVAIDKASVGKLRPAVKVANPSANYDTTHLSESQEEKPDIRHSYDDLEDDEGDAMVDRWRNETLEELEGTKEQREQKRGWAENSRSLEEYERAEAKRAEGKKRRTESERLNRESADAIAKKLRDEYHLKKSAERISGLIAKLYDFMDDDPKLSSSWIRNAVSEIAETAAYKAPLLPEAEEVLSELRGSKIYLDEKQVADIRHQFGSLADYTRKFFGGKVTFTTDASAASSLDSLWQELAGEYPWYFDPETVSNDMPAELLDVYERAKSSFDYSGDADYDALYAEIERKIKDAYPSKERDASLPFPEAEGAFVRPDDADRRGDLVRTINGFAEQEASYETEQNWREEADRETAEIDERRKAVDEMNRLLARQAAQYFADENGVPSEDIEEIKKLYGSDAAVLGALAAEDLHNVTRRKTADAMKRLAGEAKAIREGREARAKSWGELFGQAKRRVTFEGDAEVLQWNKRHLDDLISSVIKKNALSDEDVYLAGLIAAGERDASHVANESKKRAVTLLADMYAVKNAFDGKAAKTSPLVDLGVWIESPLVSNYLDARAVIGLENARKDLDRQIAVLKRGISAELGKDRAAKIFSDAKQIADRINTMSSFADLTDTERDRLRHLARLLQMRTQLVGLGTGDVRVRVKEQFDEVIKKILPDPTNAKKLPMPVLNASTFVRNNLSTFGRDVGTAINEALFRPIVRNEAEKIRFENRELGEFESTCGSFDAESSALLQFMIERGIGAENVDRFDMRRELDMYLAGIDPTENADAKAKSAVQQMNIIARKIREKFHISDEKLAQKYAERAVEAWGKESERMKSSLANISDEELDRIARAADFMRGKYAIYYEAINEFLVMHGYKPIPFRTSYAPHMQSEAVKEQFSKVAKALGIGEAVFELPTSIAGRTDAFRPGKKWNPFFQERIGKATLMDAVTGFERYVSYMSEVLYHTDDVQKLRQFSEYLRTYFADDTVKAQIAEARAALVHGEIDAEEAESRVTAALERAAENTTLSSYVSALDDYANVIAGKQTKLDRAMESFFGRRALNAGQKVQNAFVTASIVGNLSSAINQTVQLPMVAAECGYMNFSRAVADVASRRLNSTVGFDDMSTFITGKRGVERISELTKLEKVIEKGQIPFELVDDLASRIVVRAKYFQLINEGADAEEALRRADEYADSVIGSRMKGAKPLLFYNKNLAVKLFSTFQLEVANAWDHMIRDSDSVRHSAWKLLAYFLSAFILNRLLDELYGQTPVMFDALGYFYESIAEGYGVSSAMLTEKLITGTADTLGDFDRKRAKEGAKDALLDDVPYLSSLLAMFGDSSSRLPLPNFSKLSKIPGDISEGIGQFGVAQSFGDYVGAAGRMTDGLWYTAKGLVPFGNQVNKTVTGVTASIRGGGYDRNGNLMYPQGYGSFGEDLDSVTSYVFGSGANDRAGDYYASGYKGLNERGTGAYRELIDSGMDHSEAFDLVRRLSAFAPDEIEEEPVVANDLFEWLKQDYLENEFMTDAEKAAENELQSRVEKQIAFLDSQDELTDEQRLIAFRTLCASKSVRDMLGWIENDNAGEVYDTVRDIVMSHYVPDSPSKGEIIENSALSDDSKGTLWSVLAASKKDAAAAVRMHDKGESWGDVYRAYSGVSSAKSSAKDAGETQSTAGRAAIAGSSLSDEAKYEMYISSYGESAKAPDVMSDWVDHGATKAQAVKWMSAYDAARGVGHDKYMESLGKDLNAEDSAGGDTSARMEVMLDQGMTARELEAAYFGMIVTSVDEKKARENFDALKEAGGNAVDFFEAYVAVSKATWKKGEKNARSIAVKKAIDGTGATRNVKSVLYDLFNVAKSVR